jgi:cytochrome c oxidase subunit IV
MSSESHSSHAPGDAHDHGHAGHDHDDGAVHVHISSVRFYIGIFLALVCLTILTVKVSYYDFGSANIIIAMAIATTKASLVAVFFMHLAHDKKFNALTFLAAFVFLGVFIVFTYDDLGRRGEVDNDYGGTMDLKTGLAAPGGLPATTATQNDVEGEPPAEAPAGSAAPAGSGKTP